MIPGGYGWEPEDARAYYREYGDEEAAERREAEEGEDDSGDT